MIYFTIITYDISHHRLFHTLHVNGYIFTCKGGEGASTAAEFNIENSLDELDDKNEWYWDSESGDLYYFPNNTQ